MPRRYSVTLDQLRAYDADITSMADEADKVFRARAAAAMATHGDPASWTNKEAEAFRDEVSDIMAEVSSAYGGATRSMASSLMEGVLSEQGVDMEVPVGETKADRHAANQSARYWASNLFGGKRDTKAFVDGCSAYVNRKVIHSRDDCIIETVLHRRRKGPKMRYARVPMGPTCGFCLMLASRGFVYLTKESAGEFSKFHDHCNCMVLAGVEGLQVEGYDYEGMRSRYRACRDALGTADDVWEDFQKLTQEERDSYGRGERVSNVDLPPELVKKLGRQQNAFNDYYAHRITDELDRHDGEWMYSGTCRATREAARPEAAALAKSDPDGYARWQYYASLGRNALLDVAEEIAVAPARIAKLLGRGIPETDSKGRWSAVERTSLDSRGIRLRYSNDSVKASSLNEEKGWSYEEQERFKSKKNEHSRKEKKWKTAKEALEDSIITTVNMDAIENREYRKRLGRTVDDSILEYVVHDAKQILKRRSGTRTEELVYYDATDGKRLGSAVGKANASGVNPSKEMVRQARKTTDAYHVLVVLHNHPASSIPSAADMRGLLATKASYGIIIAHDGSIYRFSIAGKPDPMYDYTDKSNDDVWTKAFVRRMIRGGESAAFKDMVRLGGVKIEHFT